MTTTGGVPEGILLVDKPKGMTSFSVVASLRKKTGQKTVGHAGTLDPLATGLLVILLGRPWTRTADTFLRHDKAYEALLQLGVETDTYDAEGVITDTSNMQPTNEQVQLAVGDFQGSMLQTPPMFSAKKQGGKKLYELARKGCVVEREPCRVTVKTQILSYDYPYLRWQVDCSKGTYIRSMAHDLGAKLGCFAHVRELRRERSGPFHVSEAYTLEDLLRRDPEELSSLALRPQNLSL